MSDPTDHATQSSADLVMGAFNAKMEVGLQLRAEMTVVELAKHRAKVKQQVRSCRKCPLSSSEKCAGPVPIDGPSRGGPARVAVVGEAPGKRENELGRPFVGPAGKLMHGMMEKAGFQMDEVAWLNVVSCWPGREPPTPSRDEMVACRGNLRDQVVSTGATYVVLAGGIATQSWRGDLKVGDVHGGVFLWGGMWVVMPVFHPAAVLRDVTKKKVVLADLEKFAEVVHGDRGLEALSVVCVKCGERVVHYDPDGVGWCGRHWLRYGDMWRVEMRKWSNDKGKGIVKVKRGVGRRDTVLCDGQQEAF